jgi:hypothetical protein
LYFAEVEIKWRKYVAASLSISTSRNPALWRWVTLDGW